MQSVNQAVKGIAVACAELSTNDLIFQPAFRHANRTKPLIAFYLSRYRDAGAISVQSPEVTVGLCSCCPHECACQRSRSASAFSARSPRSLSAKTPAVSMCACSRSRDTSAFSMCRSRGASAFSVRSPEGADAVELTATKDQKIVPLAGAISNKVCNRAFVPVCGSFPASDGKTRIKSCCHWCEATVKQGSRAVVNCVKQGSGAVVNGVKRGLGAVVNGYYSIHDSIQYLLTSHPSNNTVIEQNALLRWSTGQQLQTQDTKSRAQVRENRRVYVLGIGADAVTNAILGIGNARLFLENDRLDIKSCLDWEKCLQTAACLGPPCRPTLIGCAGVLVTGAHACILVHACTPADLAGVRQDHEDGPRNERAAPEHHPRAHLKCVARPQCAPGHDLKSAFERAAPGPHPKAHLNCAARREPVEAPEPHPREAHAECVVRGTWRCMGVHGEGYMEVCGSA
eukprot:1157244-Pelagomonas_calceolata.AAC.6